MGAYAIYSNKPFKTNKPLKMKRKRGRIDEIMELVNGASIGFDKENQKTTLVKNEKVIAVFEEDENG